jgi:diadenosine tetraphosphatase ApaH/serine/threonine PP2A family protein phosphatase
MSACDTVLQGNHDKYASSNDQFRYAGLNPIAKLSGHWTEPQIADHKPVLAGLPVKAKIDGALYVHDTVIKPGDGAYMLFMADGEYTLSCYLELITQGVPIGFFGHTHKPRLYVCTEQESKGEHDTPIHNLEMFSPPSEKYTLGDNQMMLSNVGSVGQQRKDRQSSAGPDTRASYAIWDTYSRELTYRRVGYPIEKTAAKIIEADIDGFIRSEHPDLAGFMEHAIKELKSQYGMEETISRMLAWRLLNAE